jgi:hypothetical protein
MDRIIKITLSVFIVVLVTFVALVGYSAYVEHAYRTSLASSYTYTCTIATDSPLVNATLFIPIPGDRTGNSPIIAQFSAHAIGGMPGTWNTTLYGTGKSTLVKITIPSLIPPPGTTHEHPYAITLFTNTSSQTLIDTRNPVENGTVFYPVMNLTRTNCRENQTDPYQRQCYSYQTSVYADYQSDPNATVSITSALSGSNQWNIFGPQANDYSTDMVVLLPGNYNGWTTADAYLEQGIGADNPTMPFATPSDSPP